MSREKRKASEMSGNGSESEDQTPEQRKAERLYQRALFYKQKMYSKKALKRPGEGLQLGMRQLLEQPALGEYKRKALKRLTKAAEANNAEAQIELGRYCHQYGDQKGAAEWYRKAADSGSVEGRFRLANCYKFGYGVAQDHKIAFAHYEAAAFQGHLRAQSMVGLAYELGRGVEKDEAKALAWTRLVAEQGDENAQKYLQSVVPKENTGGTLLLSKDEKELFLRVKQEKEAQWFALLTGKEGVVGAPKGGEEIAKLEALVGEKPGFDPGFHAEQERAKKAEVRPVIRDESLDGFAPMNSSNAGM